MGYKNPILTEIYVELNLNGEGLGTSFLEIVPSLKDIGLSAVELAPIRHFSIHASGNEDPKVTKEHVPRVRIWSADKTMLAQLSKNQVVINLVGKYPGWDSFKKLFESIIGKAKEKSSFSIDSILLGTIDRAIVPSEGFTIDKYLDTSGDIVPRYFKGTKEPADLIIGKGIAKNDGKNRQIQVSWLPKGTHFEIVLQSKFQNIFRSVLILLIAAIVIAFLLGIYLSKNLTAPILELTKGINKVGAGAISHRINLKRKDELGAASEAFNKMASNLQKNKILEETWLRKWNKD